MDAVIELTVNKLAQIVEEKAQLIQGIKDEADELVRELRNFRAYLREATRNESDNAVLHDVVHQIQRVVNEAEDAVDTFIVQQRNHTAKWVGSRIANKVAYYKKVSDCAKDIEAIKRRAQQIRQNCSHSLNLLQASASNPQPVLQAPAVEEEDVVGFDDEAKIIKNRLTGGSKDLTIISIVGMPGLGKTTLTKMVFNDREIKHKFFTCLWVYVSRSMNRKQIFMSILSNFTKKTNDYTNMDDDQLANEIKTLLLEEKYFIVMDDVWHQKDWDSLRIAFPHNKHGSRVLVTTRDSKVANYVTSVAEPHKLKFLKPEESWDLLRKKVFRREPCPSSLEPTGRSIARKCNGLPLAVLVIAGVLDRGSTPTEWKTVAEDPFPLINKENQSYNALVKLSYDHLPFHTKDCFLYLAAFPMGHEISAWKLIRLWIAEGFIPQSPNMEATAETNLRDIVNRNLLMVLKRRSDGEIKTCRLHDTLHEFCKREALNKNLFHEVSGEETRIDTDGYRRLCIRSSPTSFITAENNPSGKHIRSILIPSGPSSTKEDIVKAAGFSKSYPVLNVFDVEPLNFKILPKDLYQLYLLRYLAISTDSKILPKPFSKLGDMQTLLFNTSQSSVDVKAEIWNMPKLRHIISKAPLQIPLPQNGEGNSSCTELQTLSPISPQSCTKELFDKTPNLLKLGVRGNLVELLESNGQICLFDSIQKLFKLENLKLKHEGNVPADIPWSFPRAEKFPHKLRKLSLSKTSFKWKNISELGLLDELEVLKLDEFAVKGDSWELNDVAFKRLYFLRIGRTDDLVNWTCRNTTFPALKCLYLSHCKNLTAVPLALMDAQSLKVLEFFHTQKAAASTQEILAQKPENCCFKLIIFPPA